MPAVADLIAWRETLWANRARGARSFQDQNGERVEFRSDAELAAAIRAVERQIAAVAAPLPTTIVFSTTKGF